MPIEAELVEQLESTVQIAVVDGIRLDNKRTYGAPTDYTAHVRSYRHIVRNSSGEEVTAEGMVYLDDAYPAVTEDVKLTLPGGSTPPIAAIETTYGLNLDTGVSGPYQTVVHYGA